MTTINDKIKNGEVFDIDEAFKKMRRKIFQDKNTTTLESEATIESVCDGLKEFLLAKNKNYGNSATEPLRVFSNSNANEGILVRIDDKLSRIKNGKELKRNDITDLCGYLVLLLKNNGWDNFEDMVD